MADRFIEIEIENEEKIILALERMQERQQRNLREMVNELANTASLTLIALTPQYNNYIMNKIDRDGPVWMPGGAGGGGEWKAIVGVKEGESKHPLYVEFGTGIYGGKGRLIFASGVHGLTGARQGVMAFKKRGEGGGKWIVRYWVRGQRGQRYFSRTWQVTNAVARSRILARNLYD